MVNGTFFLVSRLEFRKPFPEYCNINLLQLIYSKSLTLSSSKKFSKTFTFLLFDTYCGAWKEKICEDYKTEFPVFMESHSHLTEDTKNWNVSSVNFCFSGKKSWLYTKITLAHSQARFTVLLSNLLSSHINLPGSTVLL